MSTQAYPPLIGYSISYSLNRWDILRCRLWVLTHNKILMGMMILVSIVLPFLTLPHNEATQSRISFKIFYVVFMTGILLGFMGALQVVFQIIFVFLNKNRGVLGTHQLEVRDDGLLEKTSVNESLHRWAGFHKIGYSKSYLFIFVTDNLVEYVPLRCFPSPQAARDFQDEIQRRIQAAQPLHSPHQP